MVLSSCTVLPQQAVDIPDLVTDEYLFLLKHSVQNIVKPLVYHGLSISIQNKGLRH